MLSAWLVVVWIALWADLSWANLLGGMLLAGLLLRAFPPSRRALSFRPLAVVRLLAYFNWKLVEASAVVAWEVVTPPIRIRQGIVAVPMVTASETIATVVANAISLVPGTLTIEVDRDPTVLIVHVLHLRDSTAIRREVHHLELLVLRAFGDRHEIAAAEARRAQLAGSEPPTRDHSGGAADD